MLCYDCFAGKCNFIFSMREHSRATFFLSNSIATSNFISDHWRLAVFQVEKGIVMVQLQRKHIVNAE